MEKKPFSPLVTLDRMMNFGPLETCVQTFDDGDFLSFDADNLFNDSRLSPEMLPLDENSESYTFQP